MKERKAPAAEGFKVFLHELKLRAEFTIAVILISGLIALAIWAFYTWHSIPVIARVNIAPYLVAEFRNFSGIGAGEPIRVFLPQQNRWGWAYPNQIVSSWRSYYLGMTEEALWTFVLTFIGCSLLAFWLGGKYFSRKAERDLYQEKIKRGKELLPPEKLNKQLKKKYGKGRIKVTKNIIIPRKAEARHLFVVGTTGSGKSVLLSRYLSHVRDEKAIIFDLKGEFLQKFWDKAQGDLILNPFDQRTLKWSVLNDVTSPAQAYELASSFIPSPSAGEGVEKYFRDAARDVLSGIFSVCRKIGRNTNQEIWDVISSGPVELLGFLARHQEGREGAAHLVKPDSNQTAGIISTLVQFTRVLRFLPDGAFSVRKWIREDGKGFIYLVVPPQKRELYAPMVTAFMNLAIKEVLSLSDDFNRRRFLIIDELGMMQKLSSLIDGLALGRSKGLAIAIGIQDFGRIDVLYGQALRETIWNNSFTRVILRVDAPETVEYLSRALSEVEVEKGRKAYSMGAEDARDGLNVARQERTKRLVLPVQIQELSDLCCFLKAGEFPPARDEIPFQKFKKRTEPFEEIENGFSTYQEERENKVKEEVKKDEELRRLEEEAPREQKKAGDEFI